MQDKSENISIVDRLALMQRGCRILTAFIFAAAISLAVSGEAKAQSAVCLQLENELAGIDSGGGFANASPRYRQYDRAVRDQRAQIAKTERAARRNGCGGFNLFRRNSPLCQRIGASLDQMHANLQDLERNLALLSPRGANQARREALLRDIQANGCRVRSIDRRATVARQAPRRRSLLEQIFGVRTYGDDGFGSGTEYDPDTGLAARYGTFRTLCVRSCDGYYFPISFSTLPQRFFEDEQTCRAMCPGSEVELYYHRMPNQDSEDMVSARADIPYSELPNAFSYREKFDEGCTCRKAGAIAEIYDDTDFTTIDSMLGESEPEVPLPKFALDRDMDPEALANSRGRLTEGLLASLIPRPALEVTEEQKASGKSIRIVGPAFFPVQ